MKISSVVVGLVAASMGVSQDSSAHVRVTRVYDGNDFGSYYLDLPYWSYRSKGIWHRKAAHWLYENHRYVFIDIRINLANSQDALAQSWGAILGQIAGDLELHSPRHSGATRQRRAGNSTFHRIWSSFSSFCDILIGIRL